MKEIDEDDLYAENNSENNPHENERRALEGTYSDDDNMNWENFLTEGAMNVSSDDSDYAPSEFPLSDNGDDATSDIIEDDGKLALIEYIGEPEEDEEEGMNNYGMNAHELESSDDELHIARQRVQEHREHSEKERESQFSEYEDSDGDIHIVSQDEEDDDAKLKRRRRIKMTVGDKANYKEFTWEVGQRFPNITLFKEHTRKYGIFNGFSLSFVVSDRFRAKVGVICKKGCPFRVYASWHHKEGCLLVKSVKNEHSCVRDMHRNRQLTSKWLAKQYLDRFKVNPNWPAEYLMESVRKRYGVIIQRWIAYKAKTAALKMLHGSLKQHYNKLGRYIEELRRSNGSSTFELITIPSSPPIFHRMFVCFEGLRNGLIAGCRPFICLDGCHLRTFLGGILLAAVGRDGNNQMFPICWAVVESENRDSWEWFLNKLKIELHGFGGASLTLMSDQQKGLLAASASVFPGSHHKNCARHIYANWNKLHKGDELKMIFWKAVRAYNEADFEEAVEDLKMISGRAAEDFLHQNPRVFCRAFITGVTKCDVVVSNMAETFNGYILKAREKHIIDMLDTIRTLLMERMTVKNKLMDNQEGNAICPRIKLKLEEEKVKAWELTVQPSTDFIFQVREFVDVFKVNIQDRSCTCRKWDITGIPCHHGVAALSFKKETVEDYVDDYYKKEHYMKAYQGNINPCVSEKFWPKVSFSLDPPPVRILPGRPKKNRRKDPHEDPKKKGKLTKHGVQMTCSVCKSTEHNKRRCPNNNSNLPLHEKRPRGRPRKHPMNVQAHSVGPSDEGVALRGRSTSRGRRSERGRSTGRGRDIRLAATGMGVIYGEGGSILHKSSAFGHVVAHHMGNINPSQALHRESQDLSTSAPFMESET